MSDAERAVGLHLNALRLLYEMHPELDDTVHTGKNVRIEVKRQ